MSRRWETGDAAETRALGAQLARELSPEGLLLLYGEMGAGKTVLASGVAEGLGIDPHEIQSPTFTVVHEHRAGEIELLHVDLYRLSPEEVLGIGLEELFEHSAVIVVEWPERLPFAAPPGLRLRLSGKGERRTIEEMG